MGPPPMKACVSYHQLSRLQLWRCRLDAAGIPLWAAVLFGLVGIFALAVTVYSIMDASGASGVE